MTNEIHKDDINENSSFSIIDILRKIDKRLEVLTKLIGYLSFFLITPAFFILTYLGFDFNGLLGIKELTPAQKEIVSQLNISGFDPDQSGAERALSSGNTSFDNYLRAEIYPSEAFAQQAFNDFLDKNQFPPFDPALLKGYFQKFPNVANDVNLRLNKMNQIVSELSKGKEFSTSAEYCGFLAPALTNGDTQDLNAKVAKCQVELIDGQQTAFLIEMLKSLRLWNDTASGIQPPLVSDAAIVGIATLPEKEKKGTERNISKFDARIADTAPDGLVLRFQTEMIRKQPPAFYSNTGRLGNATHDQVVPPKGGNTFNMIYIEYPGDFVERDFGECDYKVCLVDFTAIVMRKEIIPISVIKQEEVDRDEMPFSTVNGFD